MHHHFECPACEFNDVEAKLYASPDEIYCSLCAADNGRDVLLIKWPVIPDVDREESRRAWEIIP
jgi:hypothetical protein